MPATSTRSHLPRYFGVPVFYGWVVVGGCFCMSIVSGAFVYARGVFLPDMADEFGGSRLAVTLAFTCAQVTGAIAAPWIGLALDRYHPRIVMLTGAVMVMFGYFLSALAPAPWFLYIVFGLLFGAGWQGIASFATSRIVVRWFRRWRGLALSIDVAGASAAGMIVPFIAVWAMSLWGWRPAMAAFGVFTLVAVIPLVVFVLKASPSEVGQYPDGDPPPAPDTDAGADAEHGAANGPAGSHESAGTDGIRTEDAAGPRVEWASRDLLKVPAFWWIMVVFSAISCVFGGILLHLFGYLSERQFGAAETAGILSLMGAMIFAGKPVSGLTADFLGVKTATALALVGMTGGMLLLWLGESYWMLASGAALYGLGFSGTTPLQSGAIAAVFGTECYGQANGLIRPFMLPISIIASPVAAAVYDTTGSYTAAFGLFVIILLLAIPALLVMNLRPVSPP